MPNPPHNTSTIEVVRRWWDGRWRPIWLGLRYGAICHACDEDLIGWSYLRHDCREVVNPRWRDYHRLPDQWVYDRLRGWLRRHPAVHKRLARYALKHFYCRHDGQCIFRNRHRGSCCWGDDDG